LYCILTGRATLKGADGGIETRLVLVQMGEFPRPRQINTACPPALEAVCLKAMAAQPVDRYPTPLALAAEVEHWLADEPVRAWPDPLAVRARRWVGRHRALAATTATALLLLALTGATVYELARRHRAAQLEQTARLVNQALGEATTLRQQ